MRRNRIVEIHENLIGGLGSNPMTMGKTKVAPNIATTCWAPTPTVLPHGSRWLAATGSPGAGSTTSHLNIDIEVPFAGCRPSHGTSDAAHETPLGGAVV